MMLTKLVALGWTVSAVASFVLGLVSPMFAGRATIWKAVGLWGLGLGAGVVATLLSFYLLRLQGQESAALRTAGKRVPVNDMPGFGQAMIAGLGLLYFAALIGLIGVIFAVSAWSHRRKLEVQRHSARARVA